MRILTSERVLEKFFDKCDSETELLNLLISSRPDIESKWRLMVGERLEGMANLMLELDIDEFDFDKYYDQIIEISFGKRCKIER